MPRRDGTGPTGIGPINGREAGFCNNVDNYGDFERCFNGYGCRGYKRRRYSQPSYSNCFRNGYSQNVQGKEEKSILENHKERLKNQIRLIEKRLASLNNPDEM